MLIKVDRHWLNPDKILYLTPAPCGVKGAVDIVMQDKCVVTVSSWGCDTVAAEINKEILKTREGM